MSYLIVGNAIGKIHRFNSSDNNTWGPTPSTVYLDCNAMIGPIQTIAFIKID